MQISAIALTPDGTLNDANNPAPLGSPISIWTTGVYILNEGSPDKSP
jgi:hypothetical protein